MTSLADTPATCRTNITEIARTAGVSTATVDRVLNLRGGVRRPTVDRVIKAANQLGYHLPRVLSAGVLPPPMRVAFVLPVGSNRYLKMFADVIEQSSVELEQYNVRGTVERIAAFNPKALAERLLQLQSNYDGVAFMALEHPLVREAVATLATNGTCVLTLISDLSNAARAAFVGMDNRSAGRTAGLLLGRFLGTQPVAGNKVAMFAGSLSYRGHEEREMGFRHIVAELFPWLEVIGIREGRDDPASNFELARALLAQNPGIIGIYNVGGASEGIAQALADIGLPHHVVFIGHGLTAETRSLLVDGTLDAVINVTPQTLMRNAVRIFCNLREDRPAMTGIDPVSIGIFLCENLP